MSVTEAPHSKASAVGAEQSADAVRLAQLEARVNDLDRRVEENRVVHDSWTLVIFAVAVVALLAGIVAVGFGMRAVDEAERQIEASLAPLATVLAASADQKSAGRGSEPARPRPGRSAGRGGAPHTDTVRNLRWPWQRHPRAG